MRITENKSLHGIEIITGVQIQEAKLTDEFQRSVTHTAKEVYKIMVIIVVNLKLIRFFLA